MTYTLQVRLSADEAAHLQQNAADSGCDNVSEFVRLLIWRERNRRSGLGQPEPHQFRSIFRGRKISPDVKPSAFGALVNETGN